MKTYCVVAKSFSLILIVCMYFNTYNAGFHIVRGENCIIHTHTHSNMRAGTTKTVEGTLMSFFTQMLGVLVILVIGEYYAHATSVVRCMYRDKYTFVMPA